MIKLGLISLLAILVCGCAMNTKQTESRLRNGVKMPDIQLSAKLEGERAAFEREIAGALDDVKGFFGKVGFDLGAVQLIDSVIVFDGTGEAREHFAKMFGTAPEEFPTTFSGTVIGQTLYVVAREQYREHWRKLYADWPWTEKEYHGLIVHELAHRAHEAIAIAKFGSADAMGPTWFFEGLAILCARQLEGSEPLMTQSEIEEQVLSNAVPMVSYPFYGRLVRSLAKLHPLNELIKRASESDFPAMMREKKR